MAKKTRAVCIGDVVVGGGAPVSVQSMTKTHTSDVAATVRQIKRLARAGAEIVRLAVPNRQSVAAFAEIKKKVKPPLVADSHFDARLALGAIEAGADAVRINPGNMRSWREVKRVVLAAKAHRIPIRIGLNSGSVRRRRGMRVAKGRTSTADAMVRLALDYCERFKSVGFRDIILSAKASDIATTMAAYRALAKACRYPLHVGLTATGPEGRTNSIIAIGGLLQEGIGDTIRVSLTAPPEEEVRVGWEILEAVGLRRRRARMVSCPTCGRTEVDLLRIVRDVRRALPAAAKDLTIAVMGCVVNGPGEAAEADLGVAMMKKSACLFAKGKLIRKIKSQHVVRELLTEIAKRK